MTFLEVQFYVTFILIFSTNGCYVIDRIRSFYRTIFLSIWQNISKYVIFSFTETSSEIPESDTKKTLYTEMMKILKDKNNCSIDKMPNGNIKVSLAGHEGCYWINNYTYQPLKDSSGRKAKVIEIMTGSGK